MICLNYQTHDLVDIPGYHFISNRTYKTGGRTGLYLQNNFQYKLVQDCSLSNSDAIGSLLKFLTHMGRTSLLELYTDLQIKISWSPWMNLIEYSQKFLRRASTAI